MVVAVVLVVCAAGWATYYQLKPPSRPPIPTGVWFIPEDKTSFEDCVVVPLDTVPPAQRDGKTLVKAFVLEVNGQKRVLYMKKLTDKAAKSMEASKGKGGMPIQTTIDMSVGSLLVKRPGDTEWVSMMSKEGGAIVREASSAKGEDIPALQ
jgi:hypothetical protein